MYGPDKSEFKFTSMKTLVCVIGQIRIPDVTWDRFKKYVLDELGADLALCIHRDSREEEVTPYHENAKYIFECHETSSCWAKKFDIMNPGWRNLVDIPGDWIAPICEPIHRPGSGGLLVYLRWFLYQNLKEEYDRIVVTRSDWVWLAPHPTLDNEHIWVPNAEFHGGVCDRHCVIPSRFVKDVLTIGQMENPEQTGNRMRHVLRERTLQGCGHFLFNDETFVFVRLCERNLMEHLGFFPLCAFIGGKNEKGVHARYPDELESSRETVTWPFYFDHKFISKNGMFCGKVHALSGHLKNQESKHI